MTPTGPSLQTDSGSFSLQIARTLSLVLVLFALRTEVVRAPRPAHVVEGLLTRERLVHFRHWASARFRSHLIARAWRTVSQWAAGARAHHENASVTTEHEAVNGANSPIVGSAD